MSVRLIAFDLDNTFLYDADTVSRGNREALEDAAAEHVMTAIASGRVFTSLPAAVLAVPSVEYAITSNGAAIYKLPKEEGRLDENGRFDADRCFTHARCIHRISLPEDRVRAIMKLLEEYPSDRYPVSFETFINGKAYSCEDYIRRPERYGLSPAYIEYVRTTRTMVADMRQFILDHADTLDGLDLQIGDPAVRDEIRSRLMAEVPDIYITASVSNRIEMSNASAGKAAGLRYLMNILGIKKGETAAFGDADNDIDVLKAAGLSVAMGNANKTVKDLCDVIVADNDRDGVVEVIDRFFR